MVNQRDNPYGTQVVATVDDLTNEQFAKLIVQAQRAFGARSQKTFGERAAAYRRASVVAALVAVHRDGGTGSTTICRAGHRLRLTCCSGTPTPRACPPPCTATCC